MLLRITENGKIKSDAAIAMISASALAVGIIVTSLTTGMTTDVSSYMFGSILAMSREDVILTAGAVGGGAGHVYVLLQQGIRRDL